MIGAPQALTAVAISADTGAYRPATAAPSDTPPETPAPAPDPGTPPQATAYDVVVDRDPHGSLWVSLFLDGTPVGADRIRAHAVDPGWGDATCGWFGDVNRAAATAGAPPAVLALVEEAASGYHQGSGNCSGSGPAGACSRSDLEDGEECDGLDCTLAAGCPSCREQQGEGRA
ncbi:hypothetical protein [Streptacidiphilus cavernicola]|uniref:Uncharacterized protein n=1 Tax=Streptacidiphilus cavernicola TaxID=3342716 RepID=A0ABV6VY51_9ACTN